MSDAYSLEWEVLQAAIIQRHHVHPDGRHSDRALDIHALCEDAVTAVAVCRALVQKNAVYDLELVWGFGAGASTLALCTAYALSRIGGRRVMHASTSQFCVPQEQVDFGRMKGRRTVLVGFEITQQCVHEIQFVRNVGVEVAGLLALTNVESRTADQFGIPKLCALIDTFPGCVGDQCSCE